MNDRQRAVLRRLRDMGYNCVFGGMRPNGVIAVLVPCKMSDGVLMLHVRRNGEYAPDGHWRKRPNHYEG